MTDIISKGWISMMILYLKIDIIKRLGAPQKTNYGGNSCFMTETEEVYILLSIITFLFETIETINIVTR